MSDPLDALRAALADRYVVERELGAGGMATVYLAHDRKHDRQVAVKVLRPELAAVLGADRFLNEIKVTANLQHPHILPLFDSGQANGFLYFVMPYVEGESLRDRLNHEKQLPVQDAMRIATEVASALDYAHRHDVIHRDIKPENILLHDGQALVADFGIALAVSAAAGGRMTETGISLGTPHYMSPEQATGDRELDARSDIYSLGCVVYEMLAGEPPHTGPTAQAILAKILTEEPKPLTQLRRTVPLHVEAAVDKALQKLPADRFATAGEFAEAVAGLRPVAASAPVVGAGAAHIRPTSRRVGVRVVVPWVLAALALGTAAGLWLWRPATTTPALHLTINLPPGVTLPMDTEHPVLALAPDGARLVFVGEERGRRRLYMRELAEREAKPMPGTEGAASPFFSPDGGWIGFFEGSTLKKVSAHGGMPVAAREVTGIGVNRGATWITENSVVFAGSVNSGLYELSVAGERRRVLGEDQVALTQETEPYAWPDGIPGGRHVLFADNAGERPDDARIAIVSIHSGEIRTLVNGGTSPRYSPTGHVLFARGGGLYAVGFDVRRAATAGPERKLLDGVATESWGAAHFTVAANGTLAYVAGDAVSSEHELVWVDRHGAVTETLLDGRTFFDPRLSPDGTRVAFSSPEGANYDIWILDLRRRLLTARLTTHPGEDLQPVWSPDGRAVAFASEIGQDQGEQGPGLAWVTGPGERPERLLRTPEVGHLEFPSSWSPDGQWLAFVASRPGTGADILLLPTSAPHEPRALIETPAGERAAMFSPDGRWIAYVSDLSGQDEVYVTPFLGPGESTRISTAGGVEPVWARNGQELFYREGDRLMVVRAGAGSWASPGTPEALFEARFAKTQWGAGSANYDVSPDGRRFLMVRRKHPVAPTFIHVVLNWPEALWVRPARPVR